MEPLASIGTALEAVMLGRVSAEIYAWHVRARVLRMAAGLPAGSTVEIKEKNGWSWSVHIPTERQEDK